MGTGRGSPEYTWEPLLPAAGTACHRDRGTIELSLGLGIFVTVIWFCESSFRVSGGDFYNGGLVAPGNTMY